MLRSLGNLFLHGIINVLCKTVKINILNSEKVERLIQQKPNYVLACWRGIMEIAGYVHRNQNISALVSQSKDGSLLANSLAKWNYKVERGSSHKGGKEALNSMLGNAENKFSIAITPDGPTGPARIMKAGAVIAAQRAQIPLVLLGVAYKKKYIFKSWDKFEVPKFFSKATLVYSEPVMLSKDLSRDEISKLITEYENLLNQLQKNAEEIS